MEQKLTKKQQKELVSDVWKDFKRRQEERKPFETQWQLNINFLIGNQYCDINSNNILKEIDKQFYWEERAVYNHIAPLIETRVAKLANVRPSMTVLPASDDEDDISNAKVCKDILKSVSNKLDFSRLVSQATRWSEICGTAFYKVVWNDSAGSIVGLSPMGENIYEGDVDVLVCSPTACGNLMVREALVVGLVRVTPNWVIIYFCAAPQRAHAAGRRWPQLSLPPLGEGASEGGG